MLTELGKFLRKLRIDGNEILKDMADKLGVTVSALSAVETGKRPMPGPWAGRISEIYGLSEEQKAEFAQSEAKTANSVTMGLENLDQEQRETALTFARRFESLDRDTLRSIREMIQKR